MKNCKGCQKEIDKKAKKCPYCHTDQRNWAARHPIWTAVIILFLIGALSNAIDTEDSTKATSTQDTTQLVSEDSNAQNKDNQQEQRTETYKMGDLVDMKGKFMAVNGVSQHQSKNPFMAPDDGNKLVAVDITTKNNSTDAYSINPFHFKLQDNQDYTYTYTATDKEPFLNAMALQPTETTRGFLVFEIPNNNTPTKIIYTPGIFDTAQIIIDLTD